MTLLHFLQLKLMSNALGILDYLSENVDYLNKYYPVIRNELTTINEIQSLSQL